jgi:nucleoside-diphosphate-sugar epimerase
MEQVRMKIAVAGATGRVGRHVVDVLKAGEHDVVAMSRSGDVDVVTGDGLPEALAGVECIIDVATGPSPDHEKDNQQNQWPDDIRRILGRVRHRVETVSIIDRLAPRRW